MQITGRHAVGSDALLIKDFSLSPTPTSDHPSFRFLQKQKSYSFLPFPFLFVCPTIPHALILYTRLWCMKKKTRSSHLACRSFTDILTYFYGEKLGICCIWWYFLCRYRFMHQRHFLIIFEIKSHRVNVKESPLKRFILLFTSFLPHPAFKSFSPLLFSVFS